MIGSMYTCSLYKTIVTEKEYLIMRVYNDSDIPNEMLLPLLEFASKGVNTNLVEVQISSTENSVTSGHCFYGRGPRKYKANPSTISLVILRYPKHSSGLWPDRFINSYILKRINAMYPAGFPFEFGQDTIVYLAAHEFRHVWQYRREINWYERRRTVGPRLAGRLPNRRGEYDAEKFALSVVNKYRIHTGRSPIVPCKQKNPFAKTDEGAKPVVEGSPQPPAAGYAAFSALGVSVPGLCLLSSNEPQSACPV